MKIRVKETFEAAHKLDFLPAGHKCTRLHGHSYWCTVRIEQRAADEHGIVVEYGEVKAIIKSLCHTYLNETISDPTTENVAKWICRKVMALIPDWAVVTVTLKEGANKNCAEVDSYTIKSDDASAECERNASLRARLGDSLGPG